MYMFMYICTYICMHRLLFVAFLLFDSRNMYRHIYIYIHSFALVCFAYIYIYTYLHIQHKGMKDNFSKSIYIYIHVFQHFSSTFIIYIHTPTHLIREFSVPCLRFSFKSKCIRRATLKLNMSEAWVDNDQGGTWKWNRWNGEEHWDGDWYYHSWREHPPQNPEKSQELRLTDDPYWPEDGHPVATSTSPHASAMAAAPSSTAAGTAQQTETAQQKLGKSTSKPRHRGGGPAFGPRLWCHIFLNKRHDDFDLVPMLIGRGGKNTRDIYDITGAKIRIRGRGSNHKEIEGIREAPVPLMVAVTSDGANASKFSQAVDMMIAKLNEANKTFAQFCFQKELDRSLAMEDIWKWGEMSKEAELVLAEEGLLGLVIPLSLSNPGERHAFPEPIPSGCTVRPATPKQMCQPKNWKPQKDVYTYAKPKLPDKPGRIDPFEKKQLQQTHDLLNHNRALNYDSRAASSSGSYFSQEVPWTTSKKEEWAPGREAVRALMGIGIQQSCAISYPHPSLPAKRCQIDPSDMEQLCKTKLNKPKYIYIYK